MDQIPPKTTLILAILMSVTILALGTYFFIGNHNRTSQIRDKNAYIATHVQAIFQCPRFGQIVILDDQPYKTSIYFSAHQSTGLTLLNEIDSIQKRWRFVPLLPPYWLKKAEQCLHTTTQENAATWIKQNLLIEYP